MTDVFKLIEDHGLTLHGDIEHFAELVRADERVHAIDISQERVDEMAKREHEWVEMQCPCGHKMYAKYTGREWVGLTDEEIYFCTNHIDRNKRGWANDFGHAIEAKLKEKNT